MPNFKMSYHFSKKDRHNLCKNLEGLKQLANTSRDHNLGILGISKL